MATLSVGFVAFAACTEIVRAIPPLFLGRRRHFEAKDKFQELSVDNVMLILLEWSFTRKDSKLILIRSVQS
jgi:hypothetical protein